MYEIKVTDILNSEWTFSSKEPPQPHGPAAFRVTDQDGSTTVFMNDNVIALSYARNDKNGGTD